MLPSGNRHASSSWRNVTLHAKMRPSEQSASRLGETKCPAADDNSRWRGSRMNQSGNSEIMRRYVEAWLSDDWDAALAFWDDDIVHHVPGRHRLAGDFAGKH